MKILLLLQFILMLPILAIMGAIKVKPIEASTTKWSENASRAAAEFATNAEAAADDWHRATIAATDNFHQAITAPGMKERFAKGVARAGAAKFARTFSYSYSHISRSVLRVHGWYSCAQS